METIDVLYLILNIFEAIAAVVGFLYFNKIKNSFWKWFPYYLTFIIISDIISRNFAKYDLRLTCKIFYGYFEIPVEFFFFFWLFHKSFDQTKYKRLPIICAVIYTASWIADMVYFSTLDFWFYSISYTIGNLLLLVLILRYFIQLVTSNAILNFKQDMLFWVSTGLLLFYLGTFPYYGLRNTLVYKYRELYTTYSYIMYVLNSLMYLMFTFSFIWGKPNIKYSSS